MPDGELRNATGEGPHRPDDVALRPDVAAVVEQYFERFRQAALATAAHPDAETVADLRAHVTGRIGLDGDVADAARVLSELGTPASLAAEVAAANPEIDAETDAESGWIGHSGTASHGRLLGVPYDLRLPSSAREASRFWNPSTGGCSCRSRGASGGASTSARLRCVRASFGPTTRTCRSAPSRPPPWPQHLRHRSLRSRRSERSGP
jgi:hypothetical protein